MKLKVYNLDSGNWRLFDRAFIFEVVKLITLSIMQEDMSHDHVSVLTISFSMLLFPHR